MEILILAVCGVVVGVMGAFLGIGGGIIIIPILTIGFGYPVHEAVGTSLAIVVANSMATSTRYIKQGSVNITIGLTIAFFSALGAIIGGFISVNIQERFLYLILGAAQMVTVIFMWRDRKRSDSSLEAASGEYKYYDQGLKRDVYYTPGRMSGVYSVGSVAGMLSGLVGIGGGVFIVPVMKIIGKLPMKVATTTSGFTMGFTAGAGGIIFFLNGYTHITALASMLPGIFIGTAVASKFFSKINASLLQKIFLVFMIFVSVQMLYRGLR